MFELGKQNKLTWLLIPLWTSACAPVLTAPAVVSDYCSIAKPIEYDSAKDTGETVKQIEQHNRRWVCLCEQICS